jgi:hypothetical protein
MGGGEACDGGEFGVVDLVVVVVWLASSSSSSSSSSALAFRLC